MSIEVLRKEDVAKILGVNPEQARQVMHQRGFPLIPIGKPLLVEKEKFYEWMRGEIYE